MKKIVLLMVSLFFVLSVTHVSAGVDVGISIDVPPPLEFEEQPDVVVVPSGSAYVYMVPDTPGLYFYNNYWYRFYDDHWYRSSIYNGSWVYIQTHRVPRFVMDVPPDYYLNLPPGYNRIHYGDLHRNWRTWERGRHWNRYDWYKREYREHQRRRGEGHGLRDTGHGLRDTGHGRRDDGRGQRDGGHKLLDDRGRRDDGRGQWDGRGLKRDGGGLLKQDGGGVRRDGGGVKRDGGGLLKQDGGGVRRDGGGLKREGGGVRREGGTQKREEGGKTHPDDKKGMERGR